MFNLKELLKKTDFTNEEIIFLLGLKDPEQCKLLQEEAYRRTTALMGNKVYYRGLIECSNICTSNCRYCGIRKDNHQVRRYEMTKQEIIDQAVWAARNGYASICLQAGERRDEKFISFIEECLREIHKQTVSDVLPDGVGVTLSLGEQTK